MPLRRCNAFASYRTAHTTLPSAARYYWTTTAAIFFLQHRGRLYLRTVRVERSPSAQTRAATIGLEVAAWQSRRPLRLDRGTTNYTLPPLFLPLRPPPLAAPPPIQHTFSSSSTHTRPTRSTNVTLCCRSNNLVLTSSRSDELLLLDPFSARLTSLYDWTHAPKSAAPSILPSSCALHPVLRAPQSPTLRPAIILRAQAAATHRLVPRTTTRCPASLGPRETLSPGSTPPAIARLNFPTNVRHFHCCR